MKKFLPLLLLCLLLVFPALCESTIYQSDFTSDLDDWYPRGTGTVELHQENDALRVTGRTAGWNSPGRAFDLVPGATYTISVEVKQETEASASFILSVEHSRDSEITYENLGRATASKGEWTTISCSWIADSYDHYVLYVETDGSPALDYSIRNFRVSGDAPQEQMQEQASSQFRVTESEEVPSLKELYADHFDIGTCVSQMDVRTASRMQLVYQQYSILTPENEMKPDAILDVANSKKLAAAGDDTAVAVHFDSAKPLLEYAKKMGMKVHGHVLVWHSQTPEAFFHVGYDTKQPLVTREVMLARLDNYIRLIFEYLQEYYPGVIVSWDVVNEAVSDNSINLRQSNWTKVIGGDFVNRAFEIADKYAPEDVLLYYNDYSTPYEPKLSGIVKLLTGLVAEGHIDGYGFQSHYGWDTPSINAVRNAFDKVQALGLKLRVSEMDITIPSDSEKNREAQAKRFAQLFELYLSYDMEAVQFWGVSDATSWIAAKHPLIFDAKLQPKPAFWAIAQLRAD